MYCEAEKLYIRKLDMLNRLMDKHIIEEEYIDIDYLKEIVFLKKETQKELNKLYKDEVWKCKGNSGEI